MNRTIFLHFTSMIYIRARIHPIFHTDNIPKVYRARTLRYNISVRQVSVHNWHLHQKVGTNSPCKGWLSNLEYSIRNHIFWGVKNVPRKLDVQVTNWPEAMLGYGAEWCLEHLYIHLWTLISIKGNHGNHVDAQKVLGRKSADWSRLISVYQTLVDIVTAYNSYLKCCELMRCNESERGFE